MPMRGARGAIGLGVCCLAAATARGDAPPGWGTLAGRLVDPDGRPAVGVRVWRERSVGYGGQPATIETRTDAAGRFRLGPLAPSTNPGNTHLYAVAEGYAVAAIPWRTTTIYPGADRDLGTTRLDRGRAFVGQAVGGDGTPIAGATVTADVKYHFMGHTVANLVPAVATTTDAAGRFRTPPLPIGHLTLQIGAPGRQPASFFRPIGPPGEEDLGAVRLEPDFPIAGTVRDEAGRPLADARLLGNPGQVATTDARGRFVLGGLGPAPAVPLRVTKPGYLPLRGRLTGVPGSYRFDAGAAGPGPELDVVLAATGLIAGTAVDAATGSPVALDLVTVAAIVRNAAGEVASLGASEDFPQADPGRFAASFARPGEFRLTFEASGYVDRSVDLPAVATLDPIGGVVARLTRRAPSDPAPGGGQRVVATITRGGRPVPAGWASAWRLPRPKNPINSSVLRGRLVVGPPFGDGSPVPIRDGSARLELASAGDVVVVVDEPGHSPAQVGPVRVAAGETKALDVACREGGAIRGRVGEVPEGWEGYGWVVAFNRAGLRAEARVDRDGSFAFPPLPPGGYGLKVGHDAYEDPEVYPGFNAQLHPEASKMVADPWREAKEVTVEAGRDVDGVEVEWPG